MDKWIVHKFGGSSVADAGCFRRVADIIEASPNPREAVVLSACRGVTDALLDLVTLAERPDGDMSGRRIEAAEEAPREARRASLVSPAACEAYCEQLERDCRDIAGMLQTVRLIRSATYSMRDVISGYGEIWSTRLFAPFLRERGPHQGRRAVDRCARGHHRRMGLARPGGSMGGERSAICSAGAARISRAASSSPDSSRPRSSGMQTTLGPQRQRFFGLHLRRLAEAPRRSSSGPMSTACCRPIRGWCRMPRSIDQLSYNEAMELAYFGAKVIHPQTMEPAVARDIPICIRNTFAPQKRGTLICANPVSALKVKGITTIDPVALVNLEGAGMIGVPGTAHRLFGALRDAGISVILISQGSSEHSICFAIPGGAGGSAPRRRCAARSTRNCATARFSMSTSAGA